MKLKKLNYNNWLLFSLIFAAYSSVYADDNCYFYAKFRMEESSFKVESASKDYIDDENVLQLQLEYLNDKSLDYKVPFWNGDCSTAYSNKGIRSKCGGDFINKDVGSNVAVKPLIYIFTLGIGAVVDAAKGVTYKTSVNKENLALAKQTSDALTSSMTAPFIAQCKQQQIDTNKQLQSAYQEQAKILAGYQSLQNKCDQTIANLNTKNTTGAQILEMDIPQISCSPEKFAEKCNDLAINEQLTNIGRKNCSVSVKNACTGYRSKWDSTQRAAFGVVSNGHTYPCDKL